jgi:hypothetical protein
MYGTETMLCLGLFTIGSLGLFIMFWVTDSNAIEDSYRRNKK